MDGKKIADRYENPFDIYLIKIGSQLGKVFIKLNITPNMITTLSLISTLIGIQYIYVEQYKIGAILYYIGYFFDCMDGNYARTYNMTSNFGDKYDHIGDGIKVIFLIICLYLLKINKCTKVLFVIISFMLGIISLIHLGCQEKIKKSDDKSVLDIFKFLCLDPNHIIYTRYFGTGTVQLFITIYIFFMKFIDNIF
tara:strand:- start:75 stop:659 length:585 start_codon:yes stop_codon:yes gene_type:complete